MSGIRVRTNSIAEEYGVKPRKGVLIRIMTDRDTKRKIAIVRWDRNKTETRISPDYIQVEDQGS